MNAMKDHTNSTPTVQDLMKRLDELDELDV